jgi:hypothetical protein
VINYRVDPEGFTALAQFDGSVVAKRTMGELSPTCHDEEANRLALNLAHDILSGARDVNDARAYYAKEFLDAAQAAHPLYGTTPIHRPDPDESAGFRPDRGVEQPL